MQTAMATGKLEERVASLEAEIAQLKRQTATMSTDLPWWNRIQGRFRDDPAYDEAMNLGKEYRNATSRDDKAA